MFKIKKVGDIYYIKNKLDGKLYIGLSIVLKQRWRKHRSELRRNTHNNHHLQKAYKEHGMEALEFGVLEENVSIDCLEEKEKFYIKKLNTFKGGYNLTNGGEFNKEISEETKEKIKQNHSKYWEGKKHSKETIKKMSEIKKGCKNSMYNQTHSKKTRIKISSNAMSFTKKESLKIYEEYYEGNVTQQQLAEKYNTYRSVIGRIVRCEIWFTKHIEYKTERKGPNKLKKEDYLKIYKEYHNSSISQKKLGEKYNLAQTTVGTVVRCEHWATRELKEAEGAL